MVGSKEELRRTAARENIRTKAGPRDTSAAPAGDVFDRGPPKRFEQDLVVEPVRNSLLADPLPAPVRRGIPLEELANPCGKRGLSASDIDGLGQRGYMVGNVVSLHDARERITSALVVVNKNAGATANKRPCTLSDMALPKKKPAEKQQRERKARRGADGRTFGDRLREAMLSHDPPYEPEVDGQTRLAAECQRLWEAGWGKRSAVKIKQQNINELLKNKQHGSQYASILAEVLGVRCAWLQFGIPPRTGEANEALVRKIVAEVQKQRRE